MNKSVGVLAGYMLTLCGASTLTGCSLIGYGLGSLGDEGHPGASLRVPEQVETLPKETTLIIRMKGGNVLRGTFVSTVQIDSTVVPENYGDEFEQWRIEHSNDSTSLPPFGSTVKILVRALSKTNIYAGRFLGLDPGVVRVLPHPEGELLSIKLEYLITVSDTLGHLISTRAAILKAVEEGAPQASRPVTLRGIIFKQKNESTLPFDDIKTANLLEPGNGKWVGLGIGAAVDAAFIIGAAISFSQMEHMGR